MSAVYIINTVRTPFGSFLGGLSQVPAPKLGGHAIETCIQRSGLAADQIDEVFVGNVLSSNLGQNPAKQAAILGGLPPTVPCTLVSKVCCSSLKAMILAAQLIKAKEIHTAVVAGMENMSLSPRIVENSRKVTKMGNVKFEEPFEAKDCMIVDGLWDSFSDKHMGALADACGKKLGISREDQDRYSIQSFKRAEDGWKSGTLEVVSFNGVESDEVIPKLIAEKVPKLRACFTQDGTITAASSSAIADGAVAAILASENYVALHPHIKPTAKIIGYADAGRDPSEFTLAPIDAAKKALEKAGKSAQSIEIWEVNEAFAVVPLMFIKEMGISEEIVNVFGGAVSIGHPLGASGLRIVNTLISALKAKGKKIGLAAICNGGGGASAVVIELVQ